MKLPNWIPALIAIWIASAATTNAQSLPFLDDFENGSEIDGVPGTWSDSGDAVQVVNGALVIAASTDRGRTSLSELVGSTNVSIQTQVEFSMLSGNRDAIVVFARSGEEGAYFGELLTDGLLAFGASRPNGGQNVWSILQTNLDPANENIHFRLDVIDDQVSLYAWPVGTAMPRQPQLSRRSGAVTDGGNLGAILIANSQGGSKDASLALPYFFIHDRPANLADVLATAIRQGSTEPAFDLNQDGELSPTDRAHWVYEIEDTYFGDANLDGEFNTGDLVAVFQAGEYEDLLGNSCWATGDWNGDGEFDTRDLVFAFQDGGFERGPRAAVTPVPEPSAIVLVISGLAGIGRKQKLVAARDRQR